MYSLDVGASRERTFIAWRTESGTRWACQGTSGHCMACAHVYASMLASSGKVDMYTLQKLLTHKSPLMTQRYAHLRDETLRQASNLAGEIVNEAVTGKAGGKIISLKG